MREQFLSHVSTCNACRDRYRFTNSVCASVHPMPVLYLKRVNISSHFNDLVGASL